jgi:cell division protein FtsZ
MNNIAFLPEPPDTPGANIKVVGVGGAGCNALNRMIESGISGVQLIAMNTDLQSLSQCGAEVKILLGPSRRGLGAGGDSDKGAVAAEESRDQILASLNGADMVFITAGMGGGTGTGAAPVVAGCANELGALSIAVVLTPCLYEGVGKANKAAKGVDALRDVADTVIVVSNEKITNFCDKNVTSKEAYRAADSVLIQGVRGISDLILRPGVVNIDFADVEAVLSRCGEALIGTGEDSSDDAILEAVRKALKCPLLERGQRGHATKAILSVMANWDLVPHVAVETAMKHLSAHYRGAPDIKLGQIDAPELGNRVIVTILASGFDDSCIEENDDFLLVPDVPEPLMEAIGSITPVYGDKPGNAEFSTPSRLLPPTPTPSGEIDGSTQDLNRPAIERHGVRTPTIIQVPPGHLPFS